jgi:hypothetical protein
MEERVYEDEYGTNTVYTCMQMEKWDLLKLFQEWEGEIKNDEGVNSIMIYLIYCKNFWKHHNVHPAQ